MDEYEIERVVGARASESAGGTGRREVRVRWKGDWPAEQKETWEPEEAFAATAGGRAALQQFEAAYNAVSVLRQTVADAAADVMAAEVGQAGRITVKRLKQAHQRLVAELADKVALAAALNLSLSQLSLSLRRRHASPPNSSRSGR